MKSQFWTAYFAIYALLIALTVLINIGEYLTTRAPIPVPAYSPWPMPQGADLSAELRWQAHEIAESTRYFSGKVKDPFQEPRHEP